MTLMNIMDNSNGYFSISMGMKAGYSKDTVLQFISKEGLERVGHGLYIAPDGWQDSLFELQHNSKVPILSHETALYLHGLADRESDRIIVTVKRGYNTSKLLSKGVKVYTAKPEIYELGITTVETSSGLSVRAYDPERCICDIIKNKKKMDIQFFQSAIKAYFSEYKPNLSRLLEYAQKMNLENRVRTYTEVLL